MVNKSKAKGTGGETELLKLLDITGMVRTPPGTKWDLERSGWNSIRSIDALATRPDHGQWLVTMGIDTFKRMLLFLDEDIYPPVTPIRIEVKRYKRFSLHTLFEGKF